MRRRRDCFSLRIKVKINVKINVKIYVKIKTWTRGLGPEAPGSMVCRGIASPTPEHSKQRP